MLHVVVFFFMNSGMSGLAMLLFGVLPESARAKSQGGTNVLVGFSAVGT